MGDLAKICLSCYIASLGLVVGGVIASQCLLTDNASSAKPPQEVQGARWFVARTTHWDAQSYICIADHGYGYVPHRESNTAYFPVFPIVVRGVAGFVGLETSAAALVVSNIALLGAYFVFAVYSRGRLPRDTDRPAIIYSCVALSIFPTTFFFRMAYSESVFLFVLLVVFLGIRRSWSPVALSLLIGLATATRPVGIVLTAPLLMHLYRNKRSRWYMGSMLIAANWGLIAYAVFVYVRFDDCFAFARAQMHFTLLPEASLREQIVAALNLDPIWGVYSAGSRYDVAAVHSGVPALFSLSYANPVFFLFALGLVALGIGKRWLESDEAVLSLLLVMVPYLLRGHAFAMNGQGRFAAVAFPVYLILGKCLNHNRVPFAVAVSFLAVCALLLVVYSAYFAAGYPLL